MNRGRTRTTTLLLLGSLALLLSGCSFTLDTTECESTAECERLVGPGSTCVDSVCTASMSVTDTTTTTEPGDMPTGDDTPVDGDTVAPMGEIISVAANIRSDETWSAANVYILEQTIFVTDDATLTISPGTLIIGRSNEPNPDDPSSLVGGSMVVTRGARLVAQGDLDAPIVFSSYKNNAALAEAPENLRDALATAIPEIADDGPMGRDMTPPAPGDWGGVAILGRAPVNSSGGTDDLEGVPTNDPDLVVFGGTEEDWNCGRLEYVRIEFAGYELAPGDELNGLTLGGCGHQTLVDHVQVHKGSDDGIEIFGGSVGIRHALISYADDDSLDWDLGWRGSAQFLAVFQDETGDKGFESDNNGGNFTASPTSEPIIYNATVVGPGAGAMRLREGTGAKIRNAIVGGQNAGVQVDGAVSVNRLLTGRLSLENSLFFFGAGTDPFATRGLTDCEIFAAHEMCLAQCMMGDAGCVSDCETATQQGFSDYFAEEVSDPDAFFAELAQPFPFCPDVLALDIVSFQEEMSRGNIFTQPGLIDPEGVGVPYLPTPDSPADGAGIAPQDTDFNNGEFDTTATYLGAFEPSDSGESWISGWTAFP